MVCILSIYGFSSVSLAEPSENPYQVMETEQEFSIILDPNNNSTEPDPVGNPADPDPIDNPIDPEPVDNPTDPDPVGNSTDPDPIDNPTDPVPTDNSTDPDLLNDSIISSPAGTTSSGGGGGGGGGGGASGENYTNIELREKYDRFIYKDITTSYCFKETGNPISCINVTGNTNAGEINTAVEVLRDMSTLVDAPPWGLVYRNVNIWVGTSGFATSKNIRDATIAFHVDKSWINENNIDPASITLMRYSGGWNALPTQKTGENDAEIYYEAITDGFSHFAITGDGQVIADKGQDLNEAPATVSSMQQENIIQDNEEVPGEPGNAGAMSTILLSGVFVGGVLNATLLLFKMNTRGRTDIFRVRY
ncbi:MAG: PGF-pre-PGF domain-containing protein [Candidatus Methanoperedens sp.]|nr:PGF-pre-PGF domain-containing protein [Candidatus Methanoperedens sp.]